MKKILILFIAMLMLFVMMGCSHQSGSSGQTQAPTPPSAPAPDPTPAPVLASAPEPAPPVMEEVAEFDWADDVGSVVDVANFSIIGAWRQTYGASGWESSNGRIVRFTDDNQANIFSPQDTFGISGRNDRGMWIHVTGLLGGNLDYWVSVVDDNHIDVYRADEVTLQFQFTRLE